ncbi:Receptor-like protein kinase HAIKU2 [Morella rubra]|uniref:non-specific serine/threonine protein kinase n=1 Tax=Morella rubra TaxID=262757 RepID=A0A6A1VHH7_9ROSI|nr:Receptor-like protein kinase HAIKU2 [Morella rubra]
MSPAHTSRPCLYHCSFFVLCFLSFLSGIQSDELQILMKLKSALQVSNTNVFKSWEATTSPCNFTGIACNSVGSVAEIELSHQNLSGILPLDSICQLQSLAKLSLGFNLLHGPVMEDLKNCAKLEYLDLGNNFFSGAVPDISSLSQLRYLHLNNSGFSGNFPWKSLQNMTGLVRLSLGDNPFNPSPIPTEVVQLTKLDWLYLSNCNIQGTIPTGIGSLTGLIDLELSDNNMTGEIPAEIGNLINLWQLELYNNSFTGKLPVGRFIRAKVLEQPGESATFQNNLSGQVPAELGDFKKLVNLSLYSNSLTGPLPQKLGSWAQFNFIDVSDNFLNGTIPPDMCKQGTMTKLLMLDNNFTGEIPATYANCSTLIRFRVNHNLLSGTVPSGIWGLPNLNIIDITSNNIEGPITSDIMNAKALGQLFVGNNRLSGELPTEISGATSLVSIQLNDNQFSGKTPPSIGDLKQLNVLHLQNNKFSGSIPETLGTCASLSDINMANNSLSGLCLLGVSSVFPRCPSGSGMSKDIRTLIICFALGSAVLLLSLACFFYSRKSKKDQGRSLREESWDVKSFHVLSFTEDEIIDSIKQENLIGKGGSGNVYKVLLANGKELAVKHIWNTDSSGNGRKRRSSTMPMLSKRGGKSKEFDTEVQMLSSIRHMNVVKLYCSITSEDSSLLVYEYLPNGSLWDRLHTCEKVKLDWQTRHEIAVGAAKGLEHLHHGCERPVIHRDVKSSNILLDEFLKPRIADFGLAKIVRASGGKDSTHVIAGTHGYIAPEYGYTYKVNEKSDVYSFGVVLMELVTGKRPMEPEFGENKDIVNWISRKITTRESVLSLVDSKIPEALKEEAIKVLRIAILCTAALPALRPTMRSVVQMLEEAEPCKLVGIFITKDGGSKRRDVKETEKLES